MKFWQKWLQPANSLILEVSSLGGQEIEGWKLGLTEVGRYYRFSKLSELVPASGKPQSGIAAVVLTHARQGIFRFLVPYLQSEKIPFTLMLHPDCLGTNRLPLAEEIAAYAGHYGPVRPWQELLQQAWQRPQEIDAMLGALRQELGPLPLERLDPLHFFVTWGKVTEIPPTLVELGLSLTAQPTEAGLEDGLSFIQRQTGVRPVVAWYARAPEGKALLHQAGLRVVVGSSSGPVLPSCPPWDLPVWDLASDEKVLTFRREN